MDLGSCPRCGSRRVSVSRRRNWKDLLLRLSGTGIFRCRQCRHRFEHSFLDAAGVAYAQCPKCLSGNLSQRNEKFADLDWITRWKLRLRAKPCFCNTCRWNFASFRPIHDTAREAAENPNAVSG